MTARDVLDLIHREGGTAIAEGNRLRLRAPCRLPDDVLALARRYKPDLLRLLSGGAGTDPDLKDLTEEFVRKSRIRLETDVGGAWLVESVDHLAGDDPDEVPFLVTLSPKDRRLLHGFKRAFNATIEPLERGENL